MTSSSFSQSTLLYILNSSTRFFRSPLIESILLVLFLGPKIAVVVKVSESVTHRFSAETSLIS
jgi:hypothetical protein